MLKDVRCYYPDGADRCTGCPRYQRPHEHPACSYEAEGFAMDVMTRLRMRFGGQPVTASTPAQVRSEIRRAAIEWHMKGGSKIDLFEHAAIEMTGRGLEISVPEVDWRRWGIAPAAGGEVRVL